MPLTKEEKTQVVEKISAQVAESEAIFAVDYRGINVPQINELRGSLREADSSFHIVKNTLTKLAAEKAGKDQLLDFLSGPTAFAFVNGDVALAAKALNKLVKDEQVIEFKGGLMGDQLLTADQIKDIAKLPVAETLQAQLVGTLSSPITTVVRGLNSMISGLAIALAQLQEQKGQEATGEQASPAEEVPSAKEEADSSPAAEASESKSEPHDEQENDSGENLSEAKADQAQAKTEEQSSDDQESIEEENDAGDAGDGSDEDSEDKKEDEES